MVGVVPAVGYQWLQRWNLEGVDGLVPRYGIGRPSKLDEVQTMWLVRVLGERNDWTLAEIKELVSMLFNVDYSDSRLREVLKSLGLRHAKPLLEDYRRPVDALPVLKKASTRLSSRTW
jgi:putative transposase